MRSVKTEYFVCIYIYIYIYICISILHFTYTVKIHKHNNKGIDRTHRIGNPRNAQKPRPIIMKIVRYNNRMKIFDSKKKLKGKKIAITEVE